jgi:EAL domain-containing protein (putative c-di-GMP-specific phosphodiesterase class I)
MYQAKDRGRGRSVFFDEAMNKRVRQRKELESELRHAVDGKELELFFQPTVDLSTGAMVGAEALLRWNHPRKGLLSPGHFIHVAEETGLIAEIGDWVLTSAFTTWQDWHDRGLVLDTLAVNVSVRQFRDDHFADRIIELARDYRLPPGLLELELTESLFIDENAGLKAHLCRLQDHGIRLAIDDFGTGFSSLSYLQRIPFDTLKIDRSFLHQVPDSARACAIARAIITLGASLDKRIVAEGVETAEQAEFFCREGDIHAQGYRYGRPMPAEDFFETALARPHDAISETAILRRINLG